MTVSIPEAGREVAESTFVALLAEHQHCLFQRILAALPHLPDAEEVLQETNLVLLRKSSKFVPGTNFGAWATRVAHFEVLKFRRRSHRDGLRFDDDLVELLAIESAARADLLEERRLALAGCLTRLSDRDRDLVRRRYRRGATTQQVSDQVGRSTKAVYNALQRIYRSLHECISRTLAAEANP